MICRTANRFKKSKFSSFFSFITEDLSILPLPPHQFVFCLSLILQPLFELKQELQNRRDKTGGTDWSYRIQHPEQSLFFNSSCWSKVHLELKVMTGTVNQSGFTFCSRSCSTAGWFRSSEEGFMSFTFTTHLTETLLKTGNKALMNERESF